MAALPLLPSIKRLLAGESPAEDWIRRRGWRGLARPIVLLTAAAAVYGAAMGAWRDPQLAFYVALKAPALGPVSCWSTEVREGKVFVRDKVERKPAIRIAPGKQSPNRIVIIGGGAAGFAAAEMLRRQDYQGSIVMLSDDGARTTSSASRTSP